MSLRCPSGLLLAALLTACSATWNDPYPADERVANVRYSAFTERPKHLDPAQSYSADEAVFTAQIYEPPLQYHYLKRPYEVIPATAVALPQPTYFDKHGRALPADADAARIAWSDYVIRIKPGIRYQPHPAFALSRIDAKALAKVNGISDFSQTATRELSAEDYVYEIKRLASPQVDCPILGLMSDYIVGLADYAKTLQALPEEQKRGWLDLRRFPLSGVTVLDRYTYRIRIKGKYPQFIYWLTMPFFAPMPWEADRFYSQPGMAEKNLTLDWYPVGTGAYMLTENNPNARMTLTRNPNFHHETYPCEGEAGDAAAGLLHDCGQTLPFIDKAVFTREKEQIPYWNKFLQGYYDASGISSDAFDQAVQVAGGDATLSDDMQRQGIRLITSVAAASFYMGFNMADPLVGGGATPAGQERARKLREAIAIAYDEEEFISIFQNGRGIAAQGPLPPGIFGYRDGEAGIDRGIYVWRDGAAHRRPIEEARRLLAEAGYPDGRDSKTGEPLVIYFDTTAGGVGAKSRIDWLNKQFQKINVQLVVRSTDYNRFQEKIRKGAAQVFYFGWNADYPDAENFFFLFASDQAKIKSQGENAANYQNPAFDRLFNQMRTMENSPARQAIIDQMMVILHHDKPWVWGYYPKDYTLYHQWLKNAKPSKVGNNTLKYERIDPVLRDQLRSKWNRPLLWPPLLALALLIALAVPAWRWHRRREKSLGV